MVTETRNESFIAWLQGMLMRTVTLRAYTIPARVVALPCGCRRSEEDIEKISSTDGGLYGSEVFQDTRWRLLRSGAKLRCERCGTQVYDCLLDDAGAA